eukprot:4395860-Pleurochrysis_carterae.AAC.1
MISFASYDNKNGAHFKFDNKNGVHFKFVVASRDVFEEYARVAHGVTRFTWNSNMAELRKGPGRL